jgi:uncharacterized protein
LVTATEVILASGNPNIQATHPTTLMITKDIHLSKNGDCIIAVAADKAMTDLSQSFKEILQKSNANLLIEIKVDHIREQVSAYGSPKLILTHSTDLVIRKSDFICNRTLGIQADKASIDLSRELAEKLKNPQSKVRITLTIQSE